MNTTTISTASQAPEVLTKQVSAWRAEVARLNDLIAHATGASQAPAVSIDTPEFREKLQAHLLQLQRTMGLQGDKRADLIAHIDAKLAQARQGALAEADIIHKDLLATMSESGKIWQHLATAAESQLEAIRQGVEALPWTYQRTAGPRLTHESVDRAAVLALLQPQPQADREAEQRNRMQERFANRPKTPAMADFDLPYASNSDGPDYSKADESGLPG